MSNSPEHSPNYEEQFAHRFTADDEQYQEYLKRSSNPPPMVEDWRVRGGGGYQRGRDNRSQEHHPFRGRDRGRGWGWSGEQRNSSHWQDRRWGSGSGGYDQGYNSYNQRPRNY